MILAQASRLSDRAHVWVSRKNNDESFTRLSCPSGHPAWAWAAQFAEQFHDDAIDALPTFED
jgi:hypothetical protein